MSADPEQEYFCEGLAEELIDALARLEGLRVAARTSAFQFGGKGHDLAEVGEKLKVKTILEGSVRRAGNRLRVNAQLINAADGYYLWSERYDRTMDDVFEVQDGIARAVVEKLKVQLLGTANQPLVKRGTDNREAHELCLKGRYHQWGHSGPALNRALECYQRALVLDSSCVQAHAGVAYVQSLRAVLGFVRLPDVMPEAKEAALKAIALDDTAADAHFGLAVVSEYQWSWVGAEREYRRALELSPGDPFIRISLALLLAKLGNAQQVVKEGREAVAAGPLSPFVRYLFALALMLVRRFRETAAEARAGIELDPNYHVLHWCVGWGSAGQGKYDEATEAFEKAVSLAPGDPISEALLGWVLGLAGRQQEALRILEGLERRRSRDYVSGWNLAIVNVGTGNHDRAISWLQHAAEDRDGLMTFNSQSLIFDPLRSDPRFQALLKKMNFPDVPAE